MIYGKLIFILILVNCELEVPESSKASKVKRVLSRSKVIPRPWVPDKSSAVLAGRPNR